MGKIKVAVIVGSLRRDSLNAKLAKAVTALAPESFDFDFVPICDLPLYNPDFEDTPNPAVTRFRDRITKTQALLIVSPEYNRSIPGGLKNALDIGSRPYGKNIWRGKPCGIMGASPGTLSTASMQQHLRNVLSTLGVITMPEPEAFIQVKDGFFGTDGSLGERTKTFLHGWCLAFAAFTTRQLS